MKVKNNIKISVNQIVDYAKGTENKKRRIIFDQKYPSPIRVGWYQTTRASIKKSLKNNGDITPILEGIDKLNKRIPLKPQQYSNRIVSIEALKRYLRIKLPPIFKNCNLQIIKDKCKSSFIDDVEIIVSPDLIFSIEFEKKVYLGAIKLHISKSNIFKIKESSFVSCLLYKYMQELSEKYNYEVLSELCLSIDVFGGNVVSTPDNYEQYVNRIKEICQDIKLLWPLVA